MSEEYPMTRTAIQFLRRWSPRGLGDFPLGDPGPPPLAQATGAPRPRIGHPRHPQADQGAPLRLTASWLEPGRFTRKELAMERLGSAGWEANWAWSLPLIVVSVLIHVLGLGLVNERVIHALKTVRDRPYFLPRFVVAMSGTVLAVTVLHAIQAIVWAVSYRLLGAMPDNKTAMLYSLSAMTSYGHASVFL